MADTKTILSKPEGSGDQRYRVWLSAAAQLPGTNRFLSPGHNPHEVGSEMFDHLQEQGVVARNEKV